jgi:hypothetical protein
LPIETQNPKKDSFHRAQPQTGPPRAQLRVSIGSNSRRASALPPVRVRSAADPDSRPDGIFLFLEIHHPRAGAACHRYAIDNLRRRILDRETRAWTAPCARLPSAYCSSRTLSAFKFRPAGHLARWRSRHHGGSAFAEKKGCAPNTGAWLILVAPVNPWSPHGKRLRAISRQCFRFRALPQHRRALPIARSFVAAPLVRRRRKIPPDSLAGYRMPVIKNHTFRHACASSRIGRQTLRNWKCAPQDSRLPHPPHLGNERPRRRFRIRRAVAPQFSRCPSGGL